MATIQTINVGTAANDPAADTIRAAFQKSVANDSAINSEIAGKLVKASNLSDLTSASTARTNLGLGTLATQSGTFSGSSSGTNTGDQDLSGLLVKSANLSDLTNAANARTNLGLGTLATQSGTISGTNTGDQTALTVPNTPAGNIAATTVQAAINELDSEKQPLSAVLTATTASFTTAQETLLASTSGVNTGDQTISLSGDVTASGGTGALTAAVTKINGTSLAGLATGILKNTTTTGVPSIAVAGDFPTLNQNTTGTAANLSGTPALPNGVTATTQTVGDSSTKLSTTAFVQGQLAVTPTGMKNRLINGAMQVDKRNSAVSQTITAAAALAYTVDRWYAYCTGANVTTQQVTVNGQKRFRFTGLASNTAVGFGQRIEAANSADLAGTTATLQVKLSSSSLTSITWTAYYANSTDTFGTLASPTRTSTGTGTFTINSTEATYSAQIAVSASATTGIEIVFTGGALLAAQTLTIGDVQLESGVNATNLERLQIGTEIDLCARYLPSIKSLSSVGHVSGGGVLTATSAQAYITFGTLSRVPPTAVSGASVTTPAQIQISGISNTTASAVSIAASSIYGSTLSLTTAAATAGIAAIYFNTASGQINFDGCEL